MTSPVPELRTDWLTGRTVLVAEHRANRPNDFERLADKPPLVGNAVAGKAVASCPFCFGNESRTPAPVYEQRNDQGAWQVRVVPNLFAAIDANVPIEIDPLDDVAAGSTRAIPAAGVHEVVIECPAHLDRLSYLSVNELAGVLQAFAHRLRHWRGCGKYRYGLVFKNQGPRAGASIAHLHSQLVALPFVPAAVAAEQQRAAEFYAREQRCPYCDLVARERAAGDRIGCERDGFLVVCPFARLQPGETWLIPTEHARSFESVTADELGRLAGVLHSLVGRLESMIPSAAYNLIVRTAPWVGGLGESSHWRIELLPRVTSLAGLELATSVYINQLAPEHAAAKLRSADAGVV